MTPMKEGTPIPGGETVDSPVVVDMTWAACKLNASHGKAHMLRAGKALRFTPDEVATYRSLGIDFDGARTQDDIDQALTAWVGTLALNWE